MTHTAHIFVPNIDAYVLAEPQMAEKLVDEYDVDKNIIYPLGIPIFDRFSEPFDKAEICKREGLDPNIPTVLLMAGSFGVTSVLKFYKSLVLQKKQIQFIVITGRNKHLYTHLKEVMEELNAQDCTKLLYFVDNVEDYMHIIRPHRNKTRRTYSYRKSCLPTSACNLQCFSRTRA